MSYQLHQSAGSNSNGFDIAILILQRPAKPEAIPVKLHAGAPVNTLNLPAMHVPLGSALLMLGYGPLVSHRIVLQSHDCITLSWPRQNLWKQGLFTTMWKGHTLLKLEGSDALVYLQADPGGDSTLDAANVSLTSRGQCSSTYASSYVSQLCSIGVYGVILCDYCSDIFLRVLKEVH